MAGDSGSPERWKLVTGVSTSLSYDDNIFIRPSHPEGDFSVQVDPSVAFGWGSFRSEVADFPEIPHLLAETGDENLPRRNFAFAEYTADAVAFAKYHQTDAVNHDFRISARDEEAVVQLHGEFHFQDQSVPNIDLGRRITTTYFTGDAGADYALTGKLTTGADLYANRSKYSGALTSTESRASAYLDYDLAPKTTVGIGAAAGYLAVERGGDQTYQQPLLRIRYLPTGKLSFTGQAGEEFRQFKSSIASRSQFVFQLNGTYEAREGTTLTAQARRQVEASAEYVGEDMVETAYEGKIRQQILQRTYLSLTGGYMHVNYIQNDVTSTVARHDDYYFGGISLARDVTTHGTVQLSYEHRENASSLRDFRFDQNVLSLSGTWLF